MALWTNREKNSQQQGAESTQSEWSELGKLEETQKLLKEKVEAQIDRLSELPGLIVSVEGHGFCKKDKLKFSVDDENYIFTRYFEKNDCIFSSVCLSAEDKIESYKQILSFC